MATQLQRVPTIQFVYFRRIDENRKWTHRCLVMSSRQFYLVTLMEQELANCPEAVEVKIANLPWRSSGIYTATFFFASEKDALTFRSRNYNNECCVIAGPIRKQLNTRTGPDQTKVPRTGPEDDGRAQVDARTATGFRELVAQEEQDMALHLHRTTPTGMYHVS